MSGSGPRLLPLSITTLFIKHKVNIQAGEALGGERKKDDGDNYYIADHFKYFPRTIPLLQVESLWFFVFFLCCSIRPNSHQWKGHCLYSMWGTTCAEIIHDTDIANVSDKLNFLLEVVPRFVREFMPMTAVVISFHSTYDYHFLMLICNLAFPFVLHFSVGPP